jgi:hypothetical protein
MSLWDDLPANLRDGGALDGLRPALDNVATPTATERIESDGRSWKVYTTALGGTDPLLIDPATGSFSRGRPASGSASTPIEFPDPSVDFELALRLDAPGGSPDGTVRLIVETPAAIVRLPFLRGALLDAQGQLRADPANPDVRFLLPALRIQFLRDPASGVSVELLSAATGPAVDQIYDFVRMEPPYALIGPGNVVGFAFRAAVLDLSGTAIPSGVPPEARAMPADWQGLYLPEARIFVAPSGLEGLAVSGGTRNLWIGFGRHAGITGIFEAEIVNRGAAPLVRLRFQTPTGEWIGIPDADPATPVTAPENVKLYVDAGGGLAPYTYAIRVDGGAPITADRTDLVVPATGSLAVEVRVNDSASHTTTRTISVSRRAALPGPTPPSGEPVTVGMVTTTGTRIVIVTQTATIATVRLEPEGGTVAWSWPGGAATAATADVPVAAGAPVTVTAVRTRAAASVLPIDAYMLFDRPNAADAQPAYADNSANVHSQPANSRTGWGSSPELVDAAFLVRLAAVPPGTTWTVQGWASYEGDNSAGQRTRNQALSERRRDVLVRILERNGFAGRVSAGTAHGHDPARTGVSPDGNPAPPPGSSSWWRARAIATLPAATTETITADLMRRATAPPATERDPEPTRAPVPDCFRKIGARVEFIRGTFIRAEIYGEFDIQTAAEQRLSASTPGSTLPPRTNPSDGICAFLVRLRVAEDRSSWDVTAEFRAIEGDLDGLAKMERQATGDQTAINVLGAVATLSPLLAAATPPSPDAGELVPMVVLGGAAVAIGASGVMATKHVILRGGELVVTDGLVNPADGSGPRTTSVSVLLDVETAFTFDLGFIRVQPDKPIITRYKAVGVRSTWESRPRTDGTVEYLPLPVFDPSRGYTLDVPAGSLVASPPLDNLLRILGVRVSRDNPTYLEVEVGMGVDLGIVKVDTVRVRLRLDALEAPQLTKLGATIDVPGTLHGVGYVEITPFGFKGAFDLTVNPLNIRASAQLAVETRNGVTGVLVGAEVQFPVPLPLGNSGLALYGFLGGVGVNYARLEQTGVQAPALKWLEAQLGPSRNSVMHPDGWGHTAGSYAFAAGLLLGTAEGGFVLHLKGIVLIEVPGPRLMLIMKADVLKLPPVLKAASSATFLAVLDLDFGRGTITIGIVAEYRVQSLLHVRVPVTAFFNTHQPAEWFVDLGTFTEPVTVQILDVFSGSGYLMLHGNGITHPRLPLVSNGLTIAVGFHLQAVLMGSKSVGLYLEVAAGFDALVSFEPFAIGGRIYARGELRLFIIGISASAELTVLVGRQRLPDGSETERTYVHGEVCGEVDFFFFSVRGCVSLTLGDTPPDEPVAPPLVAGVKLVSRSPALVEGTATDRAVDGALGDAIAVGGAGTLPTVPLDAVPVVLFEVPPSVAAGNIVLGGVAAGTNGLSADPWIRRGDRWWRYQVTGVELVGALQPSPGGKTPATWWARGAPGDPQHGPALALLSWLPTPFSRAVPYGEILQETVTQRWERVCGPVAPAARVLWTFDRQPVGPSVPGWTLEPVAWPDPPGTWRSTPVRATMTVRERWRSGDQQADLVQGTEPARVIGDAVPCPDGKFEPITTLQQWAANQPLMWSRAALPTGEAGLLAAAELLADGASLTDVPARWIETSWDANFLRRPLRCQGRLLRSPADDEAEPAPHGVEDDVRLVKEAWNKTGFTPSELADSVLFRVEEGLDALRVAVLVPRRLLEKQLVMRFRDAKGDVLAEQRLTGSDMVTTARPLPASWTDASGPWADPVERAGRIAARVAAAERSLVLALIDADPPRGVVEAEIGWDRRLFDKEAPPAFYVLALEGLAAVERWRLEWDSTSVDRDRDVLETAVTQDPDDHALFVPSETYTVRVEWRAESVKQEAKPAATAPENWGATQTQEFRFTADPPSEAPRDLAPWILASAPSMGDTGVFCREPLRLAFATQNVTALFDAYGEELRVLVRSASGRHPPAPGGGAAGAAWTLPVALDGVFVKAAPASLSIMTPWQQAATVVLNDQPCTDGSGSTTYHTIVTLPYDLEPLTDYLMDVIAVPKGAPASAAGRRVYRANFTTSRFDRVHDLAWLIQLAAVEPRLVATPAALAGLPATPSGDQLDALFQQAGLGVPQVPRYPRVQVLWSSDAVPQPVAVVVECSEAMWRERPIPTVVPGPPEAADPGHVWWKAIVTPWLSLRVSTVAAMVGDPPRAVVTRLVRAPGGTRAVALLAPGSRGSELRLELVVSADPLAGLSAQPAEAVRVLLTRAPWEEEA